MNNSTTKLMLKRTWIIALVLLTVFLTPIINAESSLYPVVTISKAQGDKCVLPPAEMRKKHPDLLKHDRISTTRMGIRGLDDGSKLQGSIKACINCHAIKEGNEYIKIDNPKHFCTSCHLHVGTSFDCFQCHRDTPEK